MDSCLRTTLFDNGKIRGDIGKFSWEKANREELLILREKYNLDKIVDNATTQFDKILSLMNWVYNLWPHHPSNQPPSQDALTILSGIEKGERYRCVEYTTLLVQLCTAFGWSARAVRLVEPYPGGPIEGQAHFVSEVWIDSLQKWVCFDPQTNSYWEYKGEPRGVLELQDIVCKGLSRKLRWRRKSPLNLLNYIEGVLEKKGIPKSFGPAALKIYSLFMAKKAFSLFFFHPRFYFYNNYFERKQGGFAPVPTVEYIHPLGRAPQLIYYGEYEPFFHTTGDRSLVDFTCNLVDIELYPPCENEPQNKLGVRLQHCIPWFKNYEMRYQGKSNWSITDSQFEWNLNPGHNLLEVRGVNSFGCHTPTSKLEIFFPETFDGSKGV